MKESALIEHTLDCLAYLLAAKKLEIRFVFVRGGVFHPKIKLLSDRDDCIAVHGSNNFTDSGLRRNVEQVSVARTWIDASEATTVQTLNDRFRQFWTADDEDYYSVIDAPDAITDNLISEYGHKGRPMPDDFWDAWDEDDQERGQGTVDAVIGKAAPSIPSWIDFKQGDWAHQGEAVKAWEAADRRGILEMATGAGKTITALVAAVRLMEEVEELLVVVTAPYKPIVEQWLETARDFGFEPIAMTKLSGRAKKLAELQRAARNLTMGLEDVAVVVGTDHLVKNEAYRDALISYGGPTLLIGDEEHNLGTNLALNALPEEFEFRLGLSATPVRQYDAEGTEDLFDYFGKVVYEFGLSDAIGRCLVPYNYYVHPVRLTDAEMARWTELSGKLASVGWTDDEEGSSPGEDELPDRTQYLLNERRKVLETADEKYHSFYDVIAEKERDALRHSLVYVSAKDSEQISEVNRGLQENFGLRIHQITYRETADDELVEDLLDRFVNEEIEMLTAMRVLDEGVDIPEVRQAFILASTTVERQWIQRRGRVLRKCDRIEKDHAELHDWLVLPPENVDKTKWRGMVKGELSRVMEFAKTARNAGAPEGPLRVIEPIVEEYLY